MPSTIRLHRVFKTTPERLYKAFIDPAAMCKWLPPHGFTGKVDKSDVRVGGSYHMSFTNFTSGMTATLPLYTYSRLHRSIDPSVNAVATLLLAIPWLALLLAAPFVGRGAMRRRKGEAA